MKRAVKDPDKRKSGKVKSSQKTSRAQKSRLPKWLGVLYQKFSSLRQRRPHHSFKRTRRRDYRRTLDLPGYFSFTTEVVRTLLRDKQIFITLIAVFSFLIIILGGLSSVETYNQLASAVQSEDLGLNTISQVAILATSVISMEPTDGIRQLYIGFMSVMVWLTTVWLLREIGKGAKPRFRDGLYSAGSPLMATLVLLAIFLVQLIPIGVLALAHGALSQLELINVGLGAFLFFGIAALLIALTLYWLTSTFFALIIITLPGMYPWRAMQAASDIVLGRRIRILFRILWLGLSIAILWVVIFVPIVFIDQWIRANNNWYEIIPLVPVAAVVMSTATIMWASAYVYLIYRKVVASDAD